MFSIQCNVVAKKHNAESNSVTNFYFFTCLWYSFFYVIEPTGYGIAWNFPKKFAAKSSAERTWQTTINKNSTMIRNQKPEAPTIVIGMFISRFYW